MPKLTKKLIDSSLPREKDYVVWDDEIKGFGCRILPSGHKTYVFHYTSPTTRKYSYLKIGVHGNYTVDLARDKAKQWCADIAQDIDPKEQKKLKQVEEQQSIIFEEFLTIFLQKYPKQAKWKPSTFNRHLSRINSYIRPFFGKKQIIDIKRKDILEFSDLLHSKKTKNKKCLDLLTSMFKQAALWEYMPRHDNPCDSVHKDADRHMDRFLTDQELVRLEETLLATETAGLASTYTIDAFRLLIYTGCRLGEVLSLKWEGVDFDCCCLRLSDSKTGKRTIPLNNSAVKVLHHVQKQADNHYVFCGKKPGAPLATIQRTWEHIRKKAGIPEFRIHDLRHSFASFMIKNGVSLFELSKLLGHKSINTTMRYAHLADKELVGVTNKGGKMFEANNKYFA